jgi:hypothetical protein
LGIASREAAVASKANTGVAKPLAQIDAAPQIVEATGAESTLERAGKETRVVFLSHLYFLK